MFLGEIARECIGTNSQITFLKQTSRKRMLTSLQWIFLWGWRQSSLKQDAHIMWYIVYSMSSSNVILYGISQQYSLSWGGAPNSYRKQGPYRLVKCEMPVPDSIIGWFRALSVLSSRRNINTFEMQEKLLEYKIGNLSEAHCLHCIVKNLCKTSSNVTKKIQCGEIISISPLHLTGT